jgi:hypothetical protein
MCNASENHEKRENMKKIKIVGAVLIPNFIMTRYNPQIGFYELSISPETIALYKEKFDNDNITDLSINHTSEILKNTKLSDSFLITTENQNQLDESFSHLPLGTWMIEYTITNESDTELIESFKLTGFSIEGKFTIVDENGKQFSVTEKFRIMNKISELLSFNIYVQGGSTEGAGRNEHGEAHFELKEKNSGKKLGKIFMPTKDKWISYNRKERLELMIVENGRQLSKREKKILVEWLEINNSENLLRCHSKWNEINKFNNRTLPI